MTYYIYFFDSQNEIEGASENKEGTQPFLTNDNSFSFLFSEKNGFRENL